MSTFVYELVDSIDDRWQEVSVLIRKASEEQNNQPELYDALCRASVVLIVAHLEGFIKEIAKSILYDINKFSSFNKSPYILRATFCKHFVGNTDSVDRKVKKLIEVLDNLNTKFSVEPFLVESTYGNNKNPSSKIINRVCDNFGVDNFFAWLKNSHLDILFSGTKSEVDTLLKSLKEHLLEGTQSYPYDLDMSRFGISQPLLKREKESLWVPFLNDQLLKSRNGIAHGSTLINSVSLSELTEFRNKVAALKYSLVLILCSKTIPS